MKCSFLFVGLLSVGTVFFCGCNKKPSSALPNKEIKKPSNTLLLMSKTEVTQKAYEKIMGKNPSSIKGDDLPVEQVSWTDAKEFCKKTGLRLPTEAQWEYACWSLGAFDEIRGTRISSRNFFGGKGCGVDRTVHF